GQGGQGALMQTSQQVQVVLAEPVFARIARMGLQAEVRVGEPAMQGFGIDAQEPTGVGKRQEEHRVTPFWVWPARRLTTKRANSREHSAEESRDDSLPRVRQGAESVPGRPPRSGAVLAWSEPSSSGEPSFGGFLAASAMVIAGPILVGASPAGPVADQGNRGGSGPDEAGEQMTH